MRLHVKLKAILLILLLALGGGFWFRSVSAASTGNMYVSPATSSVQSGNNVTVSVRINPGGASLDSVLFTLNYDTAKLQYVSSDLSGSPFNAVLTQTASGSTVQIASADISAGYVTADSFIANITFKALAGSGSTSLTLSAANADAAGTYTNPTLSAGTINFTTPTCGAGQTGTYPNCVTPHCATGQTGTYPNCVNPPTTVTTPPASTTTPTKTTTTTTPAKPTTTTTTTTTTVPGDTPPSVTGVAPDPDKLQFTQATITVTTDKPTQVYINYGLDKNLGIATALSDLSTSHTVALDPTTLLPGTTYYYTVVAKDEAGTVTQTDVKTLTTKGYTLHVVVIGKDGKPLKNATITLHSTPNTAKTDDTGLAIFNNVAPGSHHVSYTQGKKDLNQAITVANSVTTDKVSGAQSAAVQNISVQFAVASSSVPFVPIIIVLLLAVIVAAFVLFRDKLMAFKFGMSPRLQTASAGNPVVGPHQQAPYGPSQTPPTVIAPGTQPGQPSMTQRLNNLPDANTPDPGTLIRPQDDNNTLKV